VKNYISNQDESVPLFENPFLDKFTHVHFTIPLYVYLPVVAWFLYQAAIDPWLNTTGVIVLFACGLFFWTFSEYILHRFVFHYQPSSKWGQYLHFLLHGIHHAYPNDSTRLVMPPSVSIPLAVLFYYLFVMVLGASAAGPFFAAFIVGYLSYDMIHYATHHFAMKGRVGLFLKKHHMRHHYQNDERFYGVSTPIWDVVFGTMKSAAKEKEAVSA